MLCLAFLVLPVLSMADANIDATSQVDGGCPCYYSGAWHDCNKSAFPEFQCVCGPLQSDWKTSEQCATTQPPTPSPKPEQCNRTAIGQSSVYIPQGCTGTGCYDGNCGFCIYDMSDCIQAYGSAACAETEKSREAQGINGCSATPDPKQCTRTAIGQNSIYIPQGCTGTGCYDGNCGFCIYDMNACIQAYGSAACAETEKSREAQGINGCSPAPQPKQCTRTAIGQSSIYIPQGCTGTGCYDGNCGFCIYDMNACIQAYGSAACAETEKSREAQGINGCSQQVSSEAKLVSKAPEVKGGCPCYYGGRWHNCNKSPFNGDDRCVCGDKAEDWKTPEQCSATPQPPTPAPDPKQCTRTAIGQSSVYIPQGCTGTGCYAGNCGFCIYDMNACIQAYGSAACAETEKSREAQGINGCSQQVSSEAKLVSKALEVNGGCPCYYGGRWHNCNKSPFNGDDRCVCGDKAEDWKTPEQCSATPQPPTPAPDPKQCTRTAIGQSSIYIPQGCTGTGCYDGNCGFCIYDMDACIQAYGSAACAETEKSREAQGINGCSQQVSRNTLLV